MKVTALIVLGLGLLASADTNPAKETVGGSSGDGSPGDNPLESAGIIGGNSTVSADSTASSTSNSTASSMSTVMTTSSMSGSAMSSATAKASKSSTGGGNAVATAAAFLGPVIGVAAAALAL